ncbi:dual specificity protein phosphatase family protein [Variovorax sp. UMC13]|uniref:protein-tyrosine phosphatase family protein n=1 Tax=Variovorax sp. UMC13 TaxID=1862326 RepID=UPI00217FEC43|nr:dual specificity protein phosphatase family protein [Variovorax sp. UMC13]
MSTHFFMIMNDVWQPNFDWIDEQLAVGGSFPATQAALLAAMHGIDAVIDLRQEDRDDEQVLLAHGISLLHLPTEDMCGLDPGQLDDGVRFACQWLDGGRRVLIHCEHGIGRSATLALCVLVQRGSSPLDALARLKDRRSLVSPSPAQFACWQEWLERFRPHHRVSWTTPSFDDFQRIAYRHLRTT